MSYPNWIEEDRIHRVDDVLASPAKSDTPSTCHLSIVPADQELNTGWKNEMSERGYTFSFGKSVDDVRGTGVKQHLQFLDSLLSQGVRLSGCEEKYASEARSLFPMSADGSMDTTNDFTRYRISHDHSEYPPKPKDAETATGPAQGQATEA